MIKIFILFTFVAGISCFDYSVIKSLTDPLNKVSNGFFDIVRGSGKVKDYKNLTLTWNGLYEVSTHHLGFTILVAVGIIYIIMMVLSGLFVLIFRCCGRCGSKPPAMDPPKASCKRAILAVLLFVLVIAQVFSAFMIQSNNSVIYRELRSKNKQENWFERSQVLMRNLSKSLDSSYQKVKNLKISEIANKSIEKCMENIKTDLQNESKLLFQGKYFRGLLSNAGVAKKNLGNLSKSFKDNQVKKYKYMINKMDDLKSDTAETIRKVKTFTCGNARCHRNVNLYNNLNFMKDKKMNNTFENYYGFLFNDQILKELNVIQVQGIFNADMQKKIDTMEENFKKISKNLPNAMKIQLGLLLNNASKLVKDITGYLDPSTEEGNKTEKSVLKYDSYRFFGWLTIFLVVVLISLMFFIGFLFGVLGKRAEYEKQCCTKSVGSRFLMMGVGISFFLAPFLMVIVVASMTSLGSMQSEICQYTIPNSKIGPAVLDSYLNAVLQDNRYANHGIMDLLMVKCKNRSLFDLSVKLISKSVLKNITMKTGNIKFDFDTFGNYSKIEEMKKYVNEIKKGIKTDNESYVTLIEYFKDVQIIDELISQHKRLNSAYNELSIMMNEINPVNTDLLRAKEAYQLLFDKLPNLEKDTSKKVSEIIKDNILKTILTTMSSVENLKCSDIRQNLFSVFKFACSDTLIYLNGSWYGLGLFLILVIPTIIVSMVLENLYRRIQHYYKDKQEPDYDHYIGFYARADGENFHNSGNKPTKKKGKKAYEHVPMSDNP